MAETLSGTQKACYNKSAPALLATAEGVATPSERCRKNTSYDTQHNLDGEASSEVRMSSDIAQSAFLLERQAHVERERKKTEAFRAEVAASQSGACEVCATYCKPIMHIHHLMPLDHFGFTVRENLVGLCPNCHAIVHAYEHVNYNVSRFRDLETYIACNYDERSLEHLKRVLCFVRPYALNEMVHS